MTIDATFWVMISFFIFIGLLIYFKIPQKIKITLDENINDIQNQIDEANKLKEYERILDDANQEVIKIHMESKKILNKDIQTKKEAVEKEIEKEIIKAQKEINDLKKNSLSDIQKISENIASDVIEKICGDKLNESSIKAAVEDLSKKNLGKYL